MMCWRYLPCFKEKLTRSLHDNTEIEYRLPLKLWYLILSGHYCIGVIYFGFVQYSFGLIGSVYFLTIAFATTGLGDLYPDPTVAEGIFCVIYLGLGIALVSAVFSMSAFYIQNFYFVTLKRFVKKHFGHWWIFKNRPKKE
uniref:Potassium channel domain-containing protein n=1 Tax=Acrobeloides nanus TaxID=290746 RepID=A0A914DA34_9BILA